MSPTLHLLGVSFRTAPVAVRESLSFDATATLAFLRHAATLLPGVELMVISTCNRTEFLLAGDARAGDALLGCLRQLRPGAGILHTECQRYQFAGEAAAQHLFRVACGLDSAILGDGQILGQVKEAVQLAGKAGTFGKALEQVTTLAFQAARRARRQTRISAGAASVGSAIAGILTGQERLGRGASQPVRVLILGAGEMARQIGRHLAKGGGRQLVFVNRTRARAQALAADCGGMTRGWEELPAALGEADFVIAATTCSQPVLTFDVLRDARPQLVVDVGVPRNVAADLPVPVLNIDAIRAQQDEVLEQRRAAIPHVEAILVEELAAWRQLVARQPLEALLKALFADVSLVSREGAEFLTRTGGNGRDIECYLHSTLRRLLSPHARELRKLTLAT